MANRREIDPAGFRHALSAFATGVAVVTTRDTDGNSVGITISSFNSVSLDPPLVLWSVGHDSQSCDVFTEANYFAVHVLAIHQEDLCSHFAQRTEHKFDEIDCGEGLNGVPILPEFAACFECSTEHIYAGGDHKIIVGRVLRFEDRETDPLIIHRSRFLRRESPS